MTDQPDSARLTAGQFLIFIGLMTSVAGALAIIRTHDGNLFFNLLIPLGLILWAAGKYLCVTARRTPPPQ